MLLKSRWRSQEPGAKPGEEEAYAEKDSDIIGAGLAGLAAGCYGRMNGYDTEILEFHSSPGGNCTAWKRNGYVIDGCIYWLTGSGPGHYFYSVWKELGAIQGRKIYDHDVFETWVGLDGKIFYLYTDVDRLERHMIEFSPEDEPATRELCRLIRKFGSFRIRSLKTPELMNFFDKVMFMLKFAPYWKDFDMLIDDGPPFAIRFAAKGKDVLLFEDK